MWPVTVNGGTEMSARSETFGTRSSGVDLDRLVGDAEQDGSEIDLGVVGLDGLTGRAEFVEGGVGQHQEVVLGRIEHVGDPPMARLDGAAHDECVRDERDAGWSRVAPDAS